VLTLEGSWGRNTSLDYCPMPNGYLYHFSYWDDSLPLSTQTSKLITILVLILKPKKNTKCTSMIATLFSFFLFLFEVATLFSFNANLGLLKKNKFFFSFFFFYETLKK
jgi:hypothetical protein